MRRRVVKNCPDVGAAYYNPIKAQSARGNDQVEPLRFMSSSGFKDHVKRSQVHFV